MSHGPVGRRSRHRALVVPRCLSTSRLAAFVSRRGAGAAGRTIAAGRAAIPAARSVRNIRSIESFESASANNNPIRRNRTTACTTTSTGLEGPRLRGTKKPTKPKGIPKKILSELSKAGANVSKCPGEALYLIENIRFGDAAWKVFERFGETAPDKPTIGVTFCPTTEIKCNFPCPLDSLMPWIEIEASSIRNHYSKLNASSFAGGVVPAIPGPEITAFPVTQEFHTPTLALSKLFQRLQNPNHPEYPVLTAIPSGPYMCSVIHFWRNAGIIIYVFKP